MPLAIPEIRMIRTISCDQLHDWLLRNGYTPHDVATLPADTRDAIYTRFDNDPDKLMEIARIMENGD